MYTTDQQNFANTDRSKLSPDEVKRHSRHLLLPEVGFAGQLKLREAKVLLIGVGGLGSPAALYLAAAGVGNIILVDFDRVDASNLQRQILYGMTDVGSLKTSAAAERLRQLNPHITITLHEQGLSAENALELVRQADVVIDGSDNFSTRYLVNDACVFAAKPNVYGSIFRFDGQASVLSAKGGPCYRCLFAEPPPPDAAPNCAEAGVLGVLPGIIGSIQANEALKLILGIGENLIGRLLTFDALAMRWEEFHFEKNPDCSVCGKNPIITNITMSAQVCASYRSKDSHAGREITPLLLAELLQKDACVLIDVRSPQELEICRIAGGLNIPIGELETKLAGIAKNRAIVTYCKSGVRSARAAEQLQKLGYQDVRSLKGGILAWAKEIDPKLAIY